jgi:DnaJ C terminal domain
VKKNKSLQILRQTTLLKNLLASREKDLEYEAVAPTLQELHLTLEELYNGGIKIIKNDRLVLDSFATGLIPAEHRSLELKIVPGWTNDTRILYPKMGSINMCARTSDLILQVVLDPHPRFRVEDYDIYTTVQVNFQNFQSIFKRRIKLKTTTRS